MDAMKRKEEGSRCNRKEGRRENETSKRRRRGGGGGREEVGRMGRRMGG